MSEIKVDTVAEKTSANGVTVDGLNIKDSKLVTANSIVETNLTDNIVTLAKMASGTDGNIISYDASGNPVAIATGNDGQVLTSTGAGSPPAFETLSTGKVLQVVSATSTSAANTSSTSVVAFLDVSITPSSSSNKIFCVFNGLGYANGTNNDLTAFIYRGTISGTEICSTKVYDGGSSYHMYNLDCSVLDTPSTTSSQKYTIGFKPSQSLYCEFGNSGHNTTLTLMEIAG